MDVRRRRGGKVVARPDWLFLPYSEHTYVQAPYQEVTKDDDPRAELLARAASAPRINPDGE